MTLPDPTDVIAPRPDEAYDTHDFLREMFGGAYPDGVVLEYRGLQLMSQHYEDGPRVWDVYTAEDAYVETLNLEAFQTPTALQEVLDEIVAYDPDDRDEWVGSR